MSDVADEITPERWAELTRKNTAMLEKAAETILMIKRNRAAINQGIARATKDANVLKLHDLKQAEAKTKHSWKELMACLCDVAEQYQWLEVNRPT